MDIDIKLQSLPLDEYEYGVAFGRVWIWYFSPIWISAFLTFLFLLPRLPQWFFMYYLVLIFGRLRYQNCNTNPNKIVVEAYVREVLKSERCGNKRWMVAYCRSICQCALLHMFFILRYTTDGNFCYAKSVPTRYAFVIYLSVLINISNSLSFSFLNNCGIFIFVLSTTHTHQHPFTDFFPLSFIIS